MLLLVPIFFFVTERLQESSYVAHLSRPGRYSLSLLPLITCKSPGARNGYHRSTSSAHLQPPKWYTSRHTLRYTNRYTPVTVEATSQFNAQCELQNLTTSKHHQHHVAGVVLHELSREQHQQPRQYCPQHHYSHLWWYTLRFECQLKHSQYSSASRTIATAALGMRRDYAGAATHMRRMLAGATMSNGQSPL